MPTAKGWQDSSAMKYVGSKTVPSFLFPSLQEWGKGRPSPVALSLWRWPGSAQSLLKACLPSLVTWPSVVADEVRKCSSWAAVHPSKLPVYCQKVERENGFSGRYLVASITGTKKPMLIKKSNGQKMRGFLKSSAGSTLEGFSSCSMQVTGFTQHFLLFFSFPFQKKYITQG